MYVLSKTTKIYRLAADFGSDGYVEISRLNGVVCERERMYRSSIFRQLFAP